MTQPTPGRTLPRYPIYVISKGRAGLKPHTADFLIRDRVPFKMIIEAQEHDAYAARWGETHLVDLPFSNLGLGSIPARNWVWEDAAAWGVERHWILDDNIRQIHRLYRGRRLPCDAGPAFRAVEDFTDRYENVPVAGMNYHMFGIKNSPALRTNVHVYSGFLLETGAPFRWRGRYNEDTDLCLQVLAAGLCTVLVNVFLIEKMMTGNMKGGNADELYQGDGRLKMARSLERMWPGVVKVDRRFRRPQHIIDWTKFDTKLKLKPGIDLSALPPIEEYGVKLVEKRPIKSDSLRRAMS